MLRTATVTIRGAVPYSPSRSLSLDFEKLPKETPDAYEERTWRNKAHTMPDGHVFIPPMAFKMALDKAASMLSQKIPGKRNATYTKFFLSGVLCMEPLILPLTKDETAKETIFANSDGVRGSGKRVWRHFPRIDTWGGEVNFTILADEITPEAFEEHLKQAGAFVGVGRFRPEKGGFYGRFSVEKVIYH